MRERFTVAAHLSADALAARYRAASDPVPRGRLHMVWLLVAGRPLAEVAAVAGDSTRWVREVVKRDHAPGPDGLGDRRHGNRGGAPLLDDAGRAALDAALEAPPPDGGPGTSGKVAAWIAARTGRGRVAPQRGWDDLRRTGHSGAPGTAAHRAQPPDAPAAARAGGGCGGRWPPGPPPPGRSFQKA